jgi:hypothetical protein
MISPSHPTSCPAATAPSAAPAGGAALPATAASRRRELYLLLLAWSFSIFNTVRIVTYLPTVWAIHESARSDQHSLLTWFAWTAPT